MATTKKDVQRLFETFCEVYNLKTSATTRQDNPAQKDFYSNEFIKLDYNPIYGGYRLDVVQTGTGERFFDNASRMSAKEMVCYLRGLLAAKHKYRFDGITNNTEIATV
jgi:hypothetical protein